ncbi:MAG: ATP-binding protein [Spirochaetes bacterium]|nr:ATP-binding protein [Spirochaetota bacterium]
MRNSVSNDTIELSSSEKEDIKKQTYSFGILVEEIESSYDQEILQGIIKTCSDQNTDLFIFVGKAINSPHGYQKQQNQIYKLANSPKLDGLIISTATLGHYIPQEQMKEFISQYNSLPIVTIGNSFPNISGVIIENYNGMRSLLDHLIKDHNKKDIAYISGGKNYDAIERYRAFKDSMHSNGLTINPRLVYEGDFYFISGESAVHSFLRSGENFDTIVAANDSMALAAVFELQRLGFDVPGDFVVTGFDDTAESQYSNPPLTTISQPSNRVGAVAAIKLYKQLFKNEQVGTTCIPSAPVIRESCGCGINTDYCKDTTISHNSINHKEIIDTCMSSFTDITKEIIEELKTFSEKLDVIINQIIENNQEVNKHAIIDLFFISIENTKSNEKVFASWTTIISMCEDYYIRIISKKDARLKIRSVFQEARTMLASLIQKDIANNYYSLLSFNSSSRAINEFLLLSYDLDNLKTTIESFLPNVGIDSAFIALYNNNAEKEGITEDCELFFNMEDGKRSDGEGSFFKTKNILPPTRELKNHSRVLIFEPLFFENEYYGYIAYEHSMKQMVLYGNFTSQICSVLKEHYTYSKKIEIEKELKLTMNNIELINSNLSETITNINETKQKLIETEKLASLGTLVAGIAHEVNTPLGTTLLTASYLAETTKQHVDRYYENKLTKTDFEDYINKNIETGTLILDNLIKASDLITNFKQIAVDQTHFEIRDFNIRLYLNNIIQSLNSLFKKTNHSIAIEDGEDVTITGYPGAFSQVITNLITNALHHAFENDKKGLIRISYHTDDKMVSLSVSDNGVGIPEENLKHIYSPFFTTKKDEGGSGLGLQICYNLITQKMKGTIECQSSVNEGTTFTIRLPRNYTGNT